MTGNESIACSQYTWDQDLFRAKCIEGDASYRDALIRAGHLQGETRDHQLRSEISALTAELKAHIKWYKKAKAKVEEVYGDVLSEKCRLSAIAREIGEKTAYMRILHETMNSLGQVRLTRNDIADIVAKANGVPLHILRSDDRSTIVSKARQQAFAMMYDADYSSSEIGRYFSRDHSTVMHGIRAHRKREAGE